MHDYKIQNNYIFVANNCAANIDKNRLTAMTKPILCCILTITRIQEISADCDINTAFM